MAKTYRYEPRMSTETFLSGYYTNMTQLLSNVQTNTLKQFYNPIAIGDAMVTPKPKLSGESGSDSANEKPHYKLLMRTQHMRKYICMCIGYV